MAAAGGLAGELLVGLLVRRVCAIAAWGEARPLEEEERAEREARRRGPPDDWEAVN